MLPYSISFLKLESSITPGAVNQPRFLFLCSMVVPAAESSTHSRATRCRMRCRSSIFLGSWRVQGPKRAPVVWPGQVADADFLEAVKGTMDT